MTQPQAFGQSIWLVPAPFKALGMDFQNHMTLIRLTDGRLWAHSVVPLNTSLQAEVSRLGTVGHIVVPNTTHNLYTGRWRRAWPDSKLYAPPAAKRVTPDMLLAPQDLAPVQAAWGGDISIVRIAGMRYLDEYAFIHHLSRTLILTDLAFNFGAETTGRTRLALRLYGAFGRLGPSRLIRLLIRDKRAFRASIDAILEHDFDRIIVSHGQAITLEAKSRFSAAFSRYR